MHFSKALLFSGVLMTLLIGSYCLKITIQETYGIKDDGLVNKGSDYAIYCSVPEIKIGYVVVWYKKQAASIPIVLGFNDFLLDPLSKAKFKGSAVQSGEGDLTAYVLRLKEGLGAEYVDSGDYGCAISSQIPDDNADHSQMEIDFASLIVIDPVESVHLYSVRKNETHDPLKYYEEYYDGQEVRIDPGEEFYFRCVSSSSNPPANVSVFLGNKDITQQYKREVTEKYVESDDIPGSAVSHHIAYDVVLTSQYPIKIEREDNKRPLTCNASVPHEETVELTILPTMLYYPEVKCEDTRAELGEDLAKLKCRVRATPPLEKTRFVYTEETPSGGKVNRTIRVGEREGSMYVRMDRGEFEDQSVFTLEISDVTEKHFMKYTFQGGNRLGNVTATAKLIKENSIEVGGRANIAHTMPLFMLLAIVGFCLHL